MQHLSHAECDVLSVLPEARAVGRRLAPAKKPFANTEVHSLLALERT